MQSMLLHQRRPSAVTGMPSQRICPIRVSPGMSQRFGTAGLDMQEVLMVCTERKMLSESGVVGSLLELHQLIVDGVQVLTSLRQKLSQKMSMISPLSPTRALDTPSVATSIRTRSFHFR